MPKSADQGGSPASASHEALRHILDAGASMGGLAGVGRGAAAGVVRDRSWRLRTGALCRRVENVLPAGRVRSAGSPLSAGPGRRGPGAGAVRACLAAIRGRGGFAVGLPRPLLHGAECLYALGRRRDALDTLDMVLELCGSPERAALRERAELLRRSYARAD